MTNKPFNERDYRQELDQLANEAAWLKEKGEFDQTREKEYINRAYKIVNDYFKNK